MMIADDGVVIRVSATEINQIGRNTKGVRIMKIKEKSRIVCVAVTKSEKSEEKMAEELVEEEPVEAIITEPVVEDVTPTENNELL